MATSRGRAGFSSEGTASLLGKDRGLLPDSEWTAGFSPLRAVLAKKKDAG
jgi:hypothetical protein